MDKIVEKHKINAARASGRKNASSAPETETISGVVDHIIYRSEDSGYTVCVLQLSKKKGEVVVVGKCATIWPGETLKAEGIWTRHKIYGYQFNASRMLCVEPHSAAGIRKYLASGMIKGIGDVLAGRLVKKFGDDTLRIIDKESASIQEVDGIGKKRREQIKNSWNEQKSAREIMIFLHSHEVSAAQAIRIHHAYGDDAIALVRENPYRLASDIWGIGFKTADKIAMHLGIPAQSIIRARAGIIYSLQTTTEQGHCYLPRKQLLTLSEELLSIPMEMLNNAIELELTAQTLVQENENIYLAPLYYAETGIASHIRRLNETPACTALLDPDKAITWAEARMKIKFAAEQIEALKMALTEKISIITGGPGVGKTTIIRALVDIFSTKKMIICMAAPTGRAAKRMEEATKRKAMTIHRMLKFLPSTGKFEHDSDNPLIGDVFILDEVSMIDLLLMNAFVRALPVSARLILVGDSDQLPSVGPGNVLRDLIDSRYIRAVKLKTIFRQKERSWIVYNAHRVNTGRFLELPGTEELSDFYFVEEENPEKVISRAIQLITQRIPNRFGLDPKTDIQLLTPMRRFQLGSENMNAILQEAINPHGPALVRFGRIYRNGDRVMQIRNNYDKNVFNGDIGLIESVDTSDEQKIIVDFDGRKVCYDFSELDELSLAYACSIHKAQGHEHPAVVLLLTTQHYKLLQRNLLYTALTRGRKLVCLIGSKKAVAIAIRNNHIIKRRTGLRARLVSS